MTKVFQKIAQRALRYFVAGVIAVLPVVVTVAIVAWVATFLQRFVGPDAPLGSLLRAVGFTFSSETTPTLAYIFGWLLVLAVIMLVGVLVEAGARGFVHRTFDAVMSRVPLVGGVYGTSKQLVSMLDKKGDTQLSGMRAVFCHFGKEHGCGVLALLVSPQTYRIDGTDYLIVIVPTAPVPVGGGLLFVPASTVQPCELSVEALMSIYVSMGVTAPQFLAANQLPPPPIPPQSTPKPGA